MVRQVAINIWATTVLYGTGIEFSSMDNIAIPGDNECFLHFVVDIHFLT